MHKRLQQLLDVRVCVRAIEHLMQVKGTSRAIPYWMRMNQSRRMANGDFALIGLTILTMRSCFLLVCVMLASTINQQDST
jgi:hypothetical protein